MSLIDPHCDEGIGPIQIGIKSTKAFCGFCLRKFTETKTAKNLEGAGGHDDNHKTLRLFFKLFGRYVGSHSIKNNCSFLLKSNKDEDFVDALGFGSCQDCSYLMEEFCHFYNEIKILEMKMNEKLDMLCVIIKSAEGVYSRIKIMEEIFVNQDKSFKDLQHLREEVITKVSAKLKAAFPKVAIKRGHGWRKHGTKNVSTTKLLKRELRSGEEMENSEEIKLEISEPFIPKREIVEEFVIDELCDTDSEKSEISPAPPQLLSFEYSDTDNDDESKSTRNCYTACSTLKKPTTPNNLESYLCAESLDPDENINEPSFPSIENKNSHPNMDTLFDETIKDEIILQDSRFIRKDEDHVKIADDTTTAMKSTSNSFNLVMDESVCEEVAADKKLHKRKSVCKNGVKEKPAGVDDIDRKLLKLEAQGQVTKASGRPKSKKSIKPRSPPLLTSAKDSHLFANVPLSPDAIQLFGPMKKCKVKNCRKEYFTDTELDVHKNLHAEFKCSFCVIVFNYAPKLLFHEMTHVNVGDQQVQTLTSESNSKELLQCPRCPYSTKTNKKMCSHFIETHFGMSLDYNKCLICGILFYHTATGYFRKKFKSHLRIAHDYTKKIYRCKEIGCVAYFNLKLQLTLHENVHFTRKAANPIGKKTIECTKCGKMFGRKEHATDHYRRVHIEETNSPDVDNDDESCVCHHCGKTLKNPRALSSHNHQCHNKSNDAQVEAKSKKIYICETCGKHCKDICRYTLHMLAHSGPESWSFKCTNCGKRCITQQKLDEHMRTHSNEKPFSCEFCGVRYAHRHNLRIHINNKHNDISADEPRRVNTSALNRRKTMNLKKSNPEDCVTSSEITTNKSRQPTKRKMRRRRSLSDSNLSN